MEGPVLAGSIEGPVFDPPSEVSRPDDGAGDDGLDVEGRGGFSWP